MKTYALLHLLVLSLLIVFPLQAQFYFGPMAGFKAYELSGAGQSVRDGDASTWNNFDGGKTVAAFGADIGYQAMPASDGSVQYLLDLNADLMYSSVGFLEQGYNNAAGYDMWSKDIRSGGATTNFAFEILPLHRLQFSEFKILSPYAGLGLGLNYFSTSDVITIEDPPTVTGGHSEFKMGIVLGYGTLVCLSDNIQPFIQFKHYFPFGNSTQLLNDSHATLTVNDVPRFFCITGGIRFNF